MTIEWRGANPDIEAQPAASLRERLEQLTAQVESLVPAAKLEPPRRLVEELRASGIAGRILPAGSPAPAFELRDADNKVVRSADLLARGPLILLFYRGRWCPYCVAQLEAWRDLSPDVERLGASLAAISPQTVKQCSLAADQHELRFPVLSDPGNAVARRFGLVYPLPDYMREHYKGIFVNLPFINGDASWELPLAATYVLSPGANVLFAQADADFRRRPEPVDVLSALRAAL